MVLINSLFESFKIYLRFIFMKPIFFIKNDYLILDNHFLDYLLRPLFSKKLLSKYIIILL